MAILGPLRQRYRKTWDRWLERRIPRTRSLVLQQKNIFIFLTPAGAVFTGFLLVLLMTAINYRNNMVFLLTFLLASVFVVSILHTYSYLAGLRLEGGAARPVFAGQTAVFEITLGREGLRVYPDLELAFPGENPQHAAVTGEVSRLRLYWRTTARGRQRAPRIRVENRYPLGLLRAWSWVDLDMAVLVYPRPETAPAPLPAEGRGGESQVRHEAGADDFHQLRDYQPGDSLRHVAWKTLAKGQALQTRHYQAVTDRQQWLDWEQFQGLPLESRLSQLCFQVLDADRQGCRYGLKLPGQVFGPGQGQAHQEMLLRALALYGDGGAA